MAICLKWLFVYNYNVLYAYIVICIVLADHLFVNYGIIGSSLAIFLCYLSFLKIWAGVPLISGPSQARDMILPSCGDAL